MSIKNKDLFNLIEKYDKICKKLIFLESDAAGDLANKVLNKVTPQADLNDLTPTNIDIEVADNANQKFEFGNHAKWNRAKARMYINNSFVKKKPLLILGNPGESKSDTVRQTAKELANNSAIGNIINSDDFNTLTQKFKQKEEEENQTSHREYIEWDKIDEQKKLEVINNPSQYFVMMEFKTNIMDLISFKGLPESGAQSKDNRFVKWNPTMDVFYLFQNGAEGILFLDELATANPEVMNPMLNLLLNRTVDVHKLSDGIGMIAASNIPNFSKTQSNEFSTAVLGRFLGGIGVLVLDPEEWCEYQEKRGIHPLIIAYVRAHPEKIFREVFKEDDSGESQGYSDVAAKTKPFKTPRSLEAFSDSFTRLEREASNAISSKEMQPKDAWTEFWKKVIGDATSILGDGNIGKDLFNFWKLFAGYNTINAILGEKEFKDPNKVALINAALQSLFFKSFNRFTVEHKAEIENPQTSSSSQAFEPFYKKAVEGNQDYYNHFAALVIVLSKIRADFALTLINSIKNRIKTPRLQNLFGQILGKIIFSDKFKQEYPEEQQKCIQPKGLLDTLKELKITPEDLS